MARSGTRTFAVVWVGQLVSTLGSAMTGYALAIWVYEETGSAFLLASVVLAARLPVLLISPIAGVLVDRWDRRRAMIVADVGAAVSTSVILGLLLTDAFHIWHLYLALPLGSAFGAFQFPAYSAATTLMLPQKHYARAAGLVQLTGGIGRTAAPVLAAALVIRGGLVPVFVIDLASFAIAAATLVVVRFPAMAAGPATPGPLLRGLLTDAREGLDYVMQRPALVVLLLSLLMISFSFAFYGVLAVPLLLELTSAETAGLILTVGSLALVVGSLAVSVWGGPDNRIAGVYAPMLAMGVGLVMMGLRPIVGLVVAGAVLMYGTHPIAGASLQSILQSKVPTELQGRVFALRQVLTVAPTPIVYLLAGSLADRVFEPLMGRPDTPLTAVIGAGPGRGIALMFVLMGGVALAVTWRAWRDPRVRLLDAEIPDLDHHVVPAV